MKRSRSAITTLCLLALLSGCNKPEDIPDQATYTFSNQTGRRITFDVYSSKDDYSNNTNRTQQFIVEPGADLRATLEVAKKYWIDWYSPDYSYNNWQSMRTSYNRTNPPPELSIAATDDKFVLKPVVQDTTRSVLLGGGGVSTTWHATVASPQAIAGTHRFVFMKDFTGNYTYTDPGGTMSNTPFEYYISSSTPGLGVQQRFTIAVINTPVPTSAFQITCTPGNLLTPHTGRDTMLVRFLQFSSLPEMAIVRQ